MDCKIIPALQEDLDKALEQAYYRTKEPKTCIICGSKFYQGRSGVDVCGECYIDFTCPQCGKEHCRIKLDNRNRIRSIKKFILAGGDIKDYEIYCSKLCATKHNAALGLTQEACKQRMNTMKNNGTYEKWQKSCHSRESRIIAYKSMVKRGTVKRLIDGSNMPEVIKRKQESREKRAIKLGFENWQHMMHTYGAGFESNFIIKKDVLYYKDCPFTEIRDGLLSGELDIADYPGFAIKFDTVTYHNIDPLTNKKILLSGKNFELRNGVEYILDKSSGEYALWDKYKNDFQTDKINNNTIGKIEEEFNNLGGLYLQTFISKDSHSIAAMLYLISC